MGQLRILFRVHFDHLSRRIQVKALSLGADSVALDIGEFTEEQAERYLNRKGVNTKLPTWLPRKPLLLGYLAARGLLKEVLSIDGMGGAAQAWNVFLDKVCEREAALSKDIEGASVRKLLELLSEGARSTAGGTGPLFESDLAGAYTTVTGVEPLEEARMLLQRLPGLTARDQQKRGRSFVDPDMLDALQGSAVARFILTPFTKPHVENWRHPLRDLGYSLAGLLARDWNVRPSSHITAARVALDRWDAPTLAIDCILSASHRPDADLFDSDGLIIKEGLADNLDFEHCAVGNLELQWCQVGTMYIGDAHPQQVRLYQCLIDRLVGLSDAKGLPEWISGCEVGEFDSLHTNAAIMRSNSPMPVRVLLTVLRKLFLQRGRARKESAFFRGLEQGAVRYVAPVLELVRKSNVALPVTLADGTIWHPNRGQQGRIAAIIASLGTNEDPLVRQASQLK